MMNYLEAQIAWNNVYDRMVNPTRPTAGVPLICAGCALPIRAGDLCVFDVATGLDLHSTPGACVSAAQRVIAADDAAERAAEGLSDDYRAACDAALRASDPADVARQLGAIDWTATVADDRTDLEW
jgi:hypothetical protein